MKFFWITLTRYTVENLVIISIIYGVQSEDFIFKVKNVGKIKVIVDLSKDLLEKNILVEGLTRGNTDPFLTSVLWSSGKNKYFNLQTNSSEK